MRITTKTGTLCSAILLSAILLLLVSGIAKPSADVITEGETSGEGFLIDSPAGLSSQTTYTIIKDKDGFIWVSTRNGIDRFDGTNFLHYKLGDSKMRGMRDGMNITIYCDGEGDLWAFTERSLVYRFSRENDCFELALSLPEHHIWGSIQALYRYGDLLFCGATDGMTCYNLASKEIIKRFCPDDNIRTIIPFKNGELLFGSQRGVGSISLRDIAGRLTGWVDEAVNSLYYDQATKRLWIGGNGTGLHVVDPVHPDRCQRVKNTDGMVISQVSPFNGDMLVGVDGAGLWTATLTDDGYVDSFKLMASDSEEAPYPLKSSSVRSVMTDDGNIWLALYIGGIAHMQPPTPLIQLINDRGRAPSDFFAQGVSTDAEGNIWVAYEQSIACFDSHGKKPRHYLEHEAHFLTVLPASDGTVWCGGYNTGLFHFNPKTGQKEHFNSIVDQPVKDCIYHIEEEEDGDIWVGGLNFPLTRLHRNDRKAYDKKSYPGVTLVTDFDWLRPDSLVVGTTDGIYLIDTETDSIYHMLNNEQLWNGTNYISAIAPRNGHEIWVATQGAGLVCYDLKNTNNPIKAFGLDNGLPSLELRGMELINDTILCISTEDNGIFAFDCVRQSYMNSIRRSDGLLNLLFLQASSTRDNEDRVIFGGDQCAVVVRPSDMLTDLHHFEIFVVGKGLMQNRVTLPYYSRNLDIQFTTNDIYHQHEYNFYYRIKGVVDEWQTIDNSRHVRFAQLPAGKYQLEVRAVGAANQATSLTISIEAEQQPWLRWYAILGYVLIIVLLTTVTISYIARWKRKN